MATKQGEVFESDEVRDLVASFQKAMTGLRDEVGKAIVGHAAWSLKIVSHRF